MRSDYTSPDESLHELAQGRRAYGAHLMERNEMGRSVVSEAFLQGMEATAQIEGFCVQRLRDGKGERLLGVLWADFAYHYALITEVLVVTLDRAEALLYLADSVTLVAR